MLFGVLMEMEIMPDHVHILMEVDPQFGIHKAVKSLKGYTSKVLRSKVGSVSLSPRGDWRMPSDASAALWLKECELL